MNDIGRNIVTAELYHCSKNDWQLNSVVTLRKNQNGELMIDRIVVTQY